MIRILLIKHMIRFKMHEFSTSVMVHTNPLWTPSGLMAIKVRSIWGKKEKWSVSYRTKTGKTYSWNMCKKTMHFGYIYLGSMSLLFVKHKSCSRKERKRTTNENCFCAYIITRHLRLGLLSKNRNVRQSENLIETTDNYAEYKSHETLTQGEDKGHNREQQQMIKRVVVCK